MWSLRCVVVPVVVSIAQGEQGTIMDTSTGKFLTCRTDTCSWAVTPSQIFREDDGNDGQSRFHILTMDGKDTGQCLDREHCHSGSSNARMADCNHCGAVHWQYDGNRLAEDGMRNCIQSSAGIEHCDQSHAPIRWPVAPVCKVKSQTITNLQCKSTNNDGTCGASFQSGSTMGAHSTSDCNACAASPGSILQCSFSMGITSTHSYTTEFSTTSSMEVKAGIKFDMGLSFASAEVTFGISITDSLTTGRSTADTKTYNSQSACNAEIKAGSRESATATFLAGTLVGDFTANVTTQWDCPWKSEDKETTSGRLTITNVPALSTDGSCTPVNVPCHGGLVIL